MLTVEKYAWIRRAHRDGMSIRELARRFHHSRRKIREIVKTPEPRPYVRLKPVASILDGYKPVIDALHDRLGLGKQARAQPRHRGERTAQAFRVLRAKLLALTELGRLARLVETGLLPLHDARVAGEETLALQRHTQARIGLDESAGDPVPDRARLP
jgi:hypothetical protein